MSIKLQVMDYESNLKEMTDVEVQITQAVGQLQDQLAKLQQKDKDLRDAIKAAMKSEDIKKYDNEVMSLTYIAESERTTLDSKKLKDENPDLWSEYSKVSNVSDSVRIKIK